MNAKQFWVTVLNTVCGPLTMCAACSKEFMAHRRMSELTVRDCGTCAHCGARD